MEQLLAGRLLLVTVAPQLAAHLPVFGAGDAAEFLSVRSDRALHAAAERTGAKSVAACCADFQCVRAGVGRAECDLLLDREELEFCVLDVWVYVSIMV